MLLEDINTSSLATMSANRRVAGTVILYNSRYDVVENIQTYLNQIERLYVIDNSDKPNSILINELCAFPKVTYLTNDGNLGVAYALNKAARAAIQEGYAYLLTMDDDSRAPRKMLEVMNSFLNTHSSPERVGILSVAHSHYLGVRLYRKVDFTMTSGNLLNLAIYQKVGPFQDELFIDHVDHEYGLRLQLKGYEIIELCNLKLEHKLGVIKEIKLLNIKVQFVSHSPTRLYYLIRNTTFITRKYFLDKPIFCANLVWLAFKEMFKAVFFEQQKKIRIAYFFRAVHSGWLGKLGKFKS